MVRRFFELSFLSVCLSLAALFMFMPRLEPRVGDFALVLVRSHAGILGGPSPSSSTPGARCFARTRAAKGCCRVESLVPVLSPHQFLGVDLDHQAVLAAGLGRVAAACSVQRPLWCG